MTKIIQLTDTKYFRYDQGVRVTDKDEREKKGNIPIYSANVFKPRYFLKESNLKNFDYPSVLYGIDSYFDLNFIPAKQIFGNTDHCGRIEILDDAIFPEYLIHQLEIKKSELGFGRTLRANLGNMGTITIEIPEKEDGTFDIDKQKELSKKYVFLKKMKENLESERKELDEISIEIPTDGKTISKTISEIYEFEKTQSKMTKELCNSHKGTIPVYGCSYSETEVLGHIKKDVKNVKYFKDALTWNRNGSVGKFFVRKGVFCTNEDHRVLKLKRGYGKKIHAPFMKYLLENEVKKLGFTFTQKLGATNLETISINIPVDKSGKFDIKKQKELAKQYNKIYEIKNKMIQEIDDICSITVHLSSE
ncbi:hypothetical protein C5F49_01945 [Nitrosopumilus oxyclinae]|uniref:Type I restriction modification DNA specificity domain-containing protein n=1 Tax=Nitrosopumilus oxyclinae TaxID=1959104 RepID=A0A7D5M4M3_9ARCH|nr:restriction endonuclease subunit S [Nitrosopumilus oxyclinae]QLH04208.1 hypothetical protein C5F49_01945 [Nitrosopumilus oxyclinae]